MNRISVIAITVLSTLAVTAAVGLSVFSVSRAGDDGFVVLYAKQTAECNEGGGCSVMSMREIQAVVLGVLMQMQSSKQPNSRQPGGRDA